MNSKSAKRLAGSAVDEIGALLRAAATDSVLRGQILVLARLPAFQRASLVGSAVHEMTLRGEPAATRAAFGLLATDEGAAAALKFLSALE